MRSIIWLLILSYALPCYARTQLPEKDPQVKSVEDFIDNHSIVDSDGNVQLPAKQFSLPTNNNDAQSSLNRLFLQFYQTQQDQGAMEKKIEQQMKGQQASGDK